MVNYNLLLPKLDEFKLNEISKKKVNHKKSGSLSSEQSSSSSGSSVNSEQSGPESSYLHQIKSGKIEAGVRKDCLLLLDLSGQLVSNSNLVRQRASAAKDSLAAASLATGASLPLVIGNGNFEDSANDSSTEHESSLRSMNTSLRAEQRRQNVVKPQIKTSTEPIRSTAKVSTRLEDSALWSRSKRDERKSSVLDDWMDLHDRLHDTEKSSDIDAILADLSILRPQISDESYRWSSGEESDQLARMNRQHELVRLRREKMELEKGVKRQHKFFIQRIDERRRNLKIVLTVWTQREFKRAIEKLVDIYHQGLVFVACDQAGDSITHTGKREHSGLSSLNTCLVVDVISVMISRPSLWTLDICQLLLPIIVNDLLVQRDTRTHEYYVEVAIKSIGLILTHFSPVILSTLHSQVDESRLVGVDLSREDRIAKCKELERLLLEARKIAAQKKSDSRSDSRLANLYNDLDRSFSYVYPDSKRT